MRMEGFLLISNKSFSSPFDIDQVKSSNPTPQYEYGVYDVIDGYLWEKYLTNGTEKLKKIGAVSSTSSTAYPVNGVHTDGYWYERFNSRSTYVPNFDSLTDTFYNQNEITSKYQGKQYQDQSTTTQNVRQRSSYDDIIEGGYGVDTYVGSAIAGDASELSGSITLYNLNTGVRYKSLDMQIGCPTNYTKESTVMVSYDGKRIFHLRRSQTNTSRYGYGSGTLSQSIAYYSNKVILTASSGNMDNINLRSQCYNDYAVSSTEYSGYGYDYVGMASAGSLGQSTEDVYSTGSSWMIPYGSDAYMCARVFKSTTSQSGGDPALTPVFYNNRGVRAQGIYDYDISNGNYDGITSAMMISKTQCLMTVRNLTSGNGTISHTSGFTGGSTTNIYPTASFPSGVQPLRLYCIPGTTNIYVLAIDSSSYPRIYRYTHNSSTSGSLSNVTSSFSAFNSLRTQATVTSASSFKVMPGSNWVMINGYEYCRKQTTTTTTVTVDSPGYTHGNYPSKILYPISK